MSPAFLHLAHLRWFTKGAHPLPHPPTLLQIAAAAVIVLVGFATAAFLSRKLRHLEDEVDARLAPYAKWARTLLGVAIGASLIHASLTGILLSPDHPTEQRLWLVVEFYAGASWLLGFLTPVGCVLAAAVYIPLIAQGGPVSVLEHLDVLGAAAFLWFGGRGPLSLETLVGLRRPSPDLDADTRHRVFEFMTGMSLAVLGVSEKLWDLGMARVFLATHPWNALAAFGVPDDWFITCIGASEVLIGLLLACNVMSRAAVTSVLGVMTLTAIMLGPSEVTGHLFAIGLVASVWLRPRRIEAGTRLAELLEEERERVRQLEVA